MGKTIGIILGVIVLCAAVGAGAFYGGTIYERQQTANVRNSFFNGRGGTGGTGGTGGAGGGGAGGGGFGGGGGAAARSSAPSRASAAAPSRSARRRT